MIGGGEFDLSFLSVFGEGNASGGMVVVELVLMGGRLEGWSGDEMFGYMKKVRVVS